MSLGIVIKGPEGLVLAAESRVTLSASMPDGSTIPVNFDNAKKILNFEGHEYVGAVTYGLAGIGLRTAYSFLPEFENELQNQQRMSIRDFSNRLSQFFMQQWNAVQPPPPPPPPGLPPPNITLVVGGFNAGDPYGEVYLINIPTSPDPINQYMTPTTFGITWGGQREIVDRLIRGYDERVISIVQQTFSLNPEQTQLLTPNLGPLNMPIPIQFLPLQDCIDIAIFFIRTTIEAQRLTMGLRGCGGTIDVAIITRREGFRFVQQKELRGEYSPEF
jgi:20S proteasome alpha/beta subunit